MGWNVGGKRDYYAVLGVRRDAPHEVVKGAHRALIKKWHTDVNTIDPEAEERTKEINEAWATLGDPDRRRAYDRELDADASSGGGYGGNPPPGETDTENGTHDVRVTPGFIDFGGLEVGGPGTDAQITLSWNGPTPSVKIHPPSDDWWSRGEPEWPDESVNCVLFPLHAEAYDGMSPGRHRSHIDLIVDGVAHRVELVMTVIAAPSKPAPTHSGSGGYYAPPPARSHALAGFALSDDATLFVYRTSWLLTTIAALLISARIEFSALHLTPTSNVLLILLAGWWNIAVVVYGLRRTFRRKNRITIHDTNKVWLSAALVVMLLVVSIVVLVYHNGSSAQAASGGQQSNSDTGGQPGLSDSGTLPQTASTAFNVSPAFAARSATISGPAVDNAGDSFSISLTPSLSGFKLAVGVKATYDASQYTAGTSASTLTGQSCMDIKGPTTQNGMAGETYSEPPIGTNLTNSGGTITGTLTYAAILPGSYSFDFSCLGSNSSDSPLSVGSVTTTNLGISDGNNTSDGYNAVTVFAENKSATNTVIIFGAVGATKDALPPNPGSCIIYNPPSQNPEIARASSVSVYEEKRSNGQWYEMGSLTFNLSASQISNGTPAYNAAFFYNCTAGKSASGIISQGGQVILN